MKDRVDFQHKYHHKTPGKSFRWKKKIKYLLLIIFIISIVLWWKNKGESNNEHIIIEQSDAVESVKNIDEEAEEKNKDYKLCTIGEGDIPAEIFSEYGKFDANDTMALLSAAEGIYDFTNLKIGQNLRFYFDDDDRASRMEYDCNTEKKIIVERNGDEFSVREEKIEYKVTKETAKGKIENFFYVDAMDAGLSEATVLEVGDIFAFNIDFTTEIRVGDEFVFVYEKRKRDGKEAPDGRILAAKFINDGKAHYAYYYDNDGDGGYYDGDGHVLERQFLKAPLSYRRISSGYTNSRLHPITKKWTAHQQVDYAAPSGTPVVASARGTVTQASWAGGWGNMVRMKHDNGFTTHYGHLSAFAKGIKSGVQVVQGQLIGYVGSTGWSTGPHLDYGMKQDGVPVNPITFTQPKGAPLDDNDMKNFEENKGQYSNIL
ncbi:MAG: peptidoglycan DD-metalloendopeptidase family protein [Candidatus Moraniibacteriota bacterium]|jgi:murein DD-endopeptidase MepM/ murein hydrolase activator NlpD